MWDTTGRRKAQLPGAVPRCEGVGRVVGQRAREKRDGQRQRMCAAKRDEQSRLGRGRKAHGTRSFA